MGVSSSGEVGMGWGLLGIEGEENVSLSVVVEIGRVVSRVVMLWKEIEWILGGLFKWKMNEERKYVMKIVV